MSTSDKQADIAPDGMRKRVLQFAAQAWHEPVAPVYLGRASELVTRFKAHGLRHDGSPSGRPVRYFFRKLARGAGHLLKGVLIVFSLVLSLVDPGPGLDLSGGRRRKAIVTALSPAAAAVSAGRALRAGRGHLWLVMSCSRAGIVDATEAKVEFRWQSTPGSRPDDAGSGAGLVWPDGSSLALDLPPGEPQPPR